MPAKNAHLVKTILEIHNHNQDYLYGSRIESAVYLTPQLRLSNDLMNS